MHIHFIGIGGIGMSALAKYYLSQGAAISGSDLSSSEITDELGKMDVKIIIGTHKKSNLPKDVNRVIYTAATPKSNSELKEAVKRRIKRQNYAEAIGELTKQYKTITVSGNVEVRDTLTLNGEVIYPNEEGFFEKRVQLEPGLNTLEFKVKRYLGQESSLIKQVFYQPESIAPEPIIEE